MQVKGENDSVKVRRLPKKAAPPRFGKSLTPTQREQATHICLDCGYVYCLRYANLVFTFPPCQKGVWVTKDMDIDACIGLLLAPTSLLARYLMADASKASGRFSYCCSCQMSTFAPDVIGQ